MQKKVGFGCFGVVYKGMWQDAIDVALKQVTKDDDEGLEEFAGEVEMLLNLRHPNVIRFYGIFRPVGQLQISGVRCLDHTACAA